MTTIRNLKKDLIDIVGQEDRKRAHDWRFQYWAKRIDAVDMSTASGYAFEGEFIPDGTVEVEDGPALYLVRTTTGSNRRQTGHYSVVTMENGELKVTDLYATDATPGWALRLRDGVARLLSEMRERTPSQEPSQSQLSNATDEELIAELEARGYVVRRIEA